ncbi:MAG: hypothetical protein B7Z55_03660 [Planctomycetales bacterium 12-60-4]|nr:MAG: hypothetical protein B7Z55_03660 [Planctomycetales bacterium 12-60-4]
MLQSGFTARTVLSLILTIGIGSAWWSTPTLRAEDAPAGAKGDAAKAEAVKWRPLMDGVSLKNWSSIDFGGQGEVEVEDGVVTLQQGSELTGIQWIGAALPKQNYEISLEAKRVDGSDFFCGIVFPVKDDFCSFVVGGWGGGVVGLSSVDGIYAAENDTASFHTFKDNQWYRIRLRVGENFIHAWIDDKQVVELDLKDRKVSLHPAMFLAKPLAISCFSTVAAIRDVKFRELTEPERVAKPKTGK